MYDCSYDSRLAFFCFSLERLNVLHEAAPRIDVEKDADEIATPPHAQPMMITQAARHRVFGTKLSQ